MSYSAATLEALASLRASGKTAAEAEAALAADPRFAVIVDRNAIRNLHSVHPTLLVRLQDMLQQELHPDPETNLLLRGGLARLLATMQWDTGILELTNAQFATEYRQLLATFHALGKINEDEVSFFIGLGQGNLVERLTASEITSFWEIQDRTALADAFLARAQEAVETKVSTLRNQEAHAVALRNECATGADSLPALESLVSNLEA